MSLSVVGRSRTGKREQGRVRGDANLEESAAPSEERRAATVVLDLIPGSRAIALEAAASIALESGFGAPAIPSGAEEDIEDFGGGL